MNKYPKKHLLPPEAGPTPQGLNISYNTVKTTKQSGEKINGSLTGTELATNNMSLTFYSDGVQDFYIK